MTQVWINGHDVSSYVADVRLSDEAVNFQDWIRAVGDDVSPVQVEAFRREWLAGLQSAQLRLSGNWDTAPEMPAHEDIVAAIDAATGDLCACGCGRPLPPDGPSAYWFDADCQVRWNERQTTSPHEVRGSGDVDPDQMRWRPDLVTAAPDEGLTEVAIPEEWRYSGRFTPAVYERTDRPGWHLRLDDGHRFVGTDLDESADPAAVAVAWRKLERELRDPRRTLFDDSHVVIVDEIHTWQSRPTTPEPTRLLCYQGPATARFTDTDAAFPVHADIRVEQDEHVLGGAHDPVPGLLSWHGTLTLRASDVQAGRLPWRGGSLVQLECVNGIRGECYVRSIAYGGPTDEAVYEVYGSGPIEGAHLSPCGHVPQVSLAPLLVRPTLTEEEVAEMRRQLGAAFSYATEMRRQLAAAFVNAADTFRRAYIAAVPAVEVLQSAGAIEEQPPTDPMERALWLRRNRNTGPAQQRRAPRRIDPTRGR